MTETRLCPVCAESIRIAARKCKHCGEWIEGGNDHETSAVNGPHEAGVPEDEGWSSEAEAEEDEQDPAIEEMLQKMEQDLVSKARATLPTESLEVRQIKMVGSFVASAASLAIARALVRALFRI